MKKLTQLKNKDLPAIRADILEEQNFCCAICNEKITELTGIAVDHQHRNKDSIIGENGGGLIRGVLCRRCNIFEGKIFNGSRRFQIENLSSWLRSVADYLDKENYPLIHPSEKPKEKKIKKTSYKKMLKHFQVKYPKRKIPDFPKSGKCTIGLKKLFEEFGIKDYYLK